MRPPSLEITTLEPAQSQIAFSPISRATWLASTKSLGAQPSALEMIGRLSPKCENRDAVATLSLNSNPIAAVTGRNREQVWRSGHRSPCLARISCAHDGMSSQTTSARERVKRSEADDLLLARRGFGVARSVDFVMVAWCGNQTSTGLFVEAITVPSFPYATYLAEQFWPLPPMA